MSTHTDDHDELHKVEEDSLFSAEYCIQRGAIEDLRHTKEYKSASPTLQIAMELEAAHVRLAHEVETYNEHIKAFRNEKAQEQLGIIRLVKAGIGALHEKRTRYNSEMKEKTKKSTT